MAQELRRPPTRTGSGSSRPSTSRFQEGSMNDRISAAPPAQFLGPEQLKDYENQFYAEPATMHEARRPRPFSAQAQLQAATEPQNDQLQSRKHTVAHKKSTGFFGRVRDALFNRGGGGGNGSAAAKQHEVRRKHSSLQEPLQHAHVPPPPRPDYLQAGRTQSEVNIAQVFPNPRGAAGDRPSREDVMASYNQLVASGFFQSHAIQSTRHAPPAAAAAAAASAAGGRQTPVLSMENDETPRRAPLRIPSFRKSRRSGSVSPMPGARVSQSPNPQGRNSREYATATMAAPAGPRSSLSSLFRPSFPDLNTKDSRYTLRGRKRTRGDGDETPPVVSPEPQQTSSSSSTSYFTQPLRRVAKKLREMPSSSSQLNERGTVAKNKNSSVCMSPEPSNVDHSSADGIMRLVPSISAGGSLHPNERPIRLRSPSPAMPEVVPAIHGEEQRSVRPVHVHEAASNSAASAATVRARRPRRTFSYTLTESARGRTRAAEREREQNFREQLQRRGSSATRADEHNKNKNKTKNAHSYKVAKSSNHTSETGGAGQRSSRKTTRSPNPLGQWQRVSLEDTIIHRDSVDSMRLPQQLHQQHQQQQQWDWEWENRKSASVQIASSPGAGGKSRRGGANTPKHHQSPAPSPAPSPLKAITDANRSIPKAPERWHGSGKAYHLKDRGSRPDLTTMSKMVRGSEDGARGYAHTCGYDFEGSKENDSNWRVVDTDVDADGDLDILGYEDRRRGRERVYKNQNQPQQQLQDLHQWRIGNAL